MFQHVARGFAKPHYYLAAMQASLFRPYTPIVYNVAQLVENGMSILEFHIRASFFSRVGWERFRANVVSRN